MSTFKPAWIPTEKLKYKKPEQLTRKRDNDSFYSSKVWRDLRLLKLQMNPICESCKKTGNIKTANVVHHIKTREDFPELSLSIENLESVCVQCHNRKHDRHNKKTP